MAVVFAESTTAVAATDPTGSCRVEVGLGEDHSCPLHVEGLATFHGASFFHLVNTDHGDLPHLIETLLSQREESLFPKAKDTIKGNLVLPQW